MDTLEQKIKILETKTSILEIQKSDYYTELQFRKQELYEAKKKIQVLESCINEMPKYTTKLGYKYNLQKDIWENDKLKWLATFQLSELICNELSKNI